ncbi:MAG: lipopolysaccharide biosynthesis protein [Vulcanibacillus sp.]
MKFRKNALNIIKNVAFSYASNAISVAITAISLILIPKVLGVEQYGYYQLYIFYSINIAPFLHFGWINGIYLRYGGKLYEDLDKSLFFSQFWLFTIFEILISIIIILYSILFINDNSRNFIFIMIALRTTIFNPREMLLNILQGTNRIKEYSWTTIIEKIFFIIFAAGFLLIDSKHFHLMVIADLIGKICSTLIAAYYCRDIVFRNVKTLKIDRHETFQNVSVGIKMLIASIAGLLIVGIARFAIERVWDIETFGKLSLALNFSNLIVIFSGAVGIVLFPILKRINSNNLSNIYTSIKTLLMATLLATLCVFFPMKLILGVWLPNYNNSLSYMALLFPIALYESKMSLLVNTYLKALRKEKMMLIINLLSVLLSIIMTLIFAVFCKSILVLMTSVSLIIAFRCIIADIVVSKTLKTIFLKDILIEFTMTLLFMIIGWNLPLFWGFIAYSICYILYFNKEKNKIFKEFNTLKNYFIAAKN